MDYLLILQKGPNWKPALQFFEQRSGRGTPTNIFDGQLFNNI